MFGDVRNETHVLCDGRTLEIKPDVITDFTKLQFDDEVFDMVVFDPPHLLRAGEKSWLAKKYGKLGENWRDDLRARFSECFRVLKPGGTLIFKWSDVQIKLSEVLELTDQIPIFGNPRPKQSGTHFIVFMKD